MGTIELQIQANNAKIEANNTRISQLKRASADWKADADNDEIRKRFKAKDEAERARKYSVASEYASEAAVLESMNAQLSADNRALVKQREAEGQSMIELSKQGTTPAAVLTKATAEAQAATAVANSQATAIQVKATSEANSQADADKQRMMVMVTVVVIVVIITTVILAKKLKKTKK